MGALLFISQLFYWLWRHRSTLQKKYLSGLSLTRNKFILSVFLCTVLLIRAFYHWRRWNSSIRVTVTLALMGEKVKYEIWAELSLKNGRCRREYFFQNDETFFRLLVLNEVGSKYSSGKRQPRVLFEGWIIDNRRGGRGAAGGWEGEVNLLPKEEQTQLSFCFDESICIAETNRCGRLVAA